MLGHRSNQISKQRGFSDAGKLARMQKQKAPAQVSLNRGLRLSANSLISDETYQNPSGPLSASQLDESRRETDRAPEILRSGMKSRTCYRSRSYSLFF